MNDAELKNILYKMVLIRTFEEAVASLSKSGEVHCPVHLSVGQEAISAAICEVLTNQDRVFSTHRNHAHYLAKGGNINELMAEIMCKETGCSHGKGGSMHVVDRRVHFMGSSAIVAGTIPISVGAALADKYKNRENVSVAFFGDGASDEGIFYESVNLSVLYNLPVIFVCENNDFATHLPNFRRQSNISVSDRIRGFKISTAQVDGNNSVDILIKAESMIQQAREGGGPSLLECHTYRWFSHAGYWADLDVGFRKKKDVEYWMSKCPITQLYNMLKEKRYLSEQDFMEMKENINLIVNEAVTFARNSISPGSSFLYSDC